MRGGGSPSGLPSGPQSGPPRSASHPGVQLGNLQHYELQSVISTLTHRFRKFHPLARRGRRPAAHRRRRRRRRAASRRRCRRGEARSEMARMAASMDHDEDAEKLKLGPGVLLNHHSICARHTESLSPVSASRLQQFQHAAERGGGPDSRAQAERVAGQQRTAEEHLFEVV